MQTGQYVSEPAMWAAEHYYQRSCGIPVDPEVAFADHRGRLQPRCEARQKRLLAKLGFLRPCLDEDEVVLLVTTATSPFSPWEQLAAGWAVHVLRRCLLVFTDRRFFHVPTTPDFRYRRSLAMVPYAACTDLRVRGGALRATYADGHRETFGALARAERRTLAMLLARRPEARTEAAMTGRTFLCPNCGVALDAGLEPCRSCGQAFRDRATARWWTLLLPGGGYFYTGHAVLGIVDALVETYLTLLVLLAALAAWVGADVSATSWAIPGLALGLDKLVGLYQADRFLDDHLPLPAGSPRVTEPVPSTERVEVIAREPIATVGLRAGRGC